MSKLNHELIPAGSQALASLHVRLLCVFHYEDAF